MMAHVVSLFCSSCICHRLRCGVKQQSSLTWAPFLNRRCRQFGFRNNPKCLWLEGIFHPPIFITLFVWEEIWSRCFRFIYIKLITTWHYNSFWGPWGPFPQTRQSPFASYKWVQDPNSLHLGPNLARIGGVWDLATEHSPLPAEAWMGFYRLWNVDFLMIQMNVTIWWFNPPKRQWSKTPPCLCDFFYFKKKWERRERIRNSYRKADNQTHTCAHTNTHTYPKFLTN